MQGRGVLQAAHPPRKTYEKIGIDGWFSMMESHTHVFMMYHPISYQILI